MPDIKLFFILELFYLIFIQKCQRFGKELPSVSLVHSSIVALENLAAKFIEIFYELLAFDPINDQK